MRVRPPDSGAGATGGWLAASFAKKDVSKRFFEEDEEVEEAEVVRDFAPTAPASSLPEAVGILGRAGGAGDMSMACGEE